MIYSLSKLEQLITQQAGPEWACANTDKEYLCVCNNTIQI